MIRSNCGVIQLNHDGFWAASYGKWPKSSTLCDCLMSITVLSVEKIPVLIMNPKYPERPSRRLPSAVRLSVFETRDFLPLSRGKFGFLLQLCDYPYSTTKTINKVCKIINNTYLFCDYMSNIITRSLPTTTATVPASAPAAMSLPPQRPCRAGPSGFPPDLPPIIAFMWGKLKTRSRVVS